MPWVQTSSCIGCGKCVSACPEGAIELEEGLPVIDQKSCRRYRCCECQQACPVDAMKPGFKATGT